MPIFSLRHILFCIIYTVNINNIWHENSIPIFYLFCIKQLMVHYLIEINFRIHIYIYIYNFVFRIRVKSFKLYIYTTQCNIST